MNYYYQPYWLQPNELEHHGVEGQKWGVRNGPPYPLDSRLSELTRKPSKMTAEEDMAMVNNGHTDNHTFNCLYCTAAMEMRRRGYDVVAKQRDAPTSYAKILKWFPGTEIKQIKPGPIPKIGIKRWGKKNYDMSRELIKSWGDGSRGFIRAILKGPDVNYGHLMSWEVENGVVTFYDTQNNIKNPRQFFETIKSEITYGRLDEARLDPSVVDALLNRK